MAALEIDEKAEARALTPNVAAPTLLYVPFIWAVHGSMLYAALSGIGSYWMWTIPLGYIAFCHYTYVHEAIHGNILPNGRFNRLFQEGLGWIGAVTLFANWPLLSRTHKGHHSHTNTDQDPDVFVQKALWRLLLRNAITTSLLLVPIPVLKLLVRDRSPAMGYFNADIAMTSAERRGHYIANAIMVGAVWGLVFGGFAAEVFLLYFIPAMLGYSFLAVVFIWLPHHPFERGDRYHTTRNLGHRWLNPILQQQNWHLMHHLWPSVPFYNYEKLYHRLKPVLIEKGARYNDGIVPKEPRATGDSASVPAE
ncbi:MAG: fatty acid desaturase [Pseudomonadota bacterium]